MRPILAILAAVAVASALQAQNGAVPYQPYGRIISTEIRPPDFGMIKFRGRELTPAEVAATEEEAFTFGSLSAKDTRNSDSGSFSVGYGTKWVGHDVVFVGSYSRLRPRIGDDHDRAIAYGEVTLADTRLVTVAGSVAAVYDPDSFKVYNPVLAAEHAFIPKTFKAALNLGWVQIDPKSGKGISDFQPAVGVTLSPDKHHLWSFGVDYTLDNNVDEEDTGSVSVSRTLARYSSKLKLSVEKHQVISLSLTKFF